MTNAHVRFSLSAGPLLGDGLRDVLESRVEK